jgi:uncharacterized protein YggE
MRIMTLTRTVCSLLAAALLVSASASASAQQAASSEPDIETVGTGTRRIAPDRASVHVTIQTRARSAAAAASANATAVQAVMDTLRRAGLDSAASTSSYHVGPDYDRRPVSGEPQVIGYVAHTTLRVRPPRIDLVGRVIDASFAKGATGVEGVFFESSRAEEARREAMADAAAAARRDAEALARALDGTLGPLLSTSTVGAGDPRRLNVAMAETQLRTTQITPGELVVTAAVVTRWRFLPR